METHSLVMFYVKYTTILGTDSVSIGGISVKVRAPKNPEYVPKQYCKNHLLYYFIYLVA